MTRVSESTMGIKLNAQRDPNNPFLNVISKLYYLAAQRMTKPWLHNDLVFAQIHHQIKEYRKSAHNFVDKVFPLYFIFIVIMFDQDVSKISLMF